MISTFGARWLASSEVISPVLFTSERRAARETLKIDQFSVNCYRYSSFWCYLFNLCGICHDRGPIFPSTARAGSVSKLFITWHSVSDSKMHFRCNQSFFSLFWLQILNLPASLQNKNTRVGPFPWKQSVLQNPGSTGICLRLGLPHNNGGYFPRRFAARQISTTIHLHLSE